MIGIKVQNLIWEKALLDLLAPDAEKYQENHSYGVVVSDKKLTDKCIILGKDVPVPFRFEVLKEKIIQIQGPEFKNEIFEWLPQMRQLIHKKSQNVIQLTEKESEIISFLAKCPQHRATKEEILQAVWHYQSDVHTHTLETHLYALRQKIAPDINQLITTQDGIYELIF